MEIKEYKFKKGQKVRDVQYGNIYLDLNDLINLNSVLIFCIEFH